MWKTSWRGKAPFTEMCCIGGFTDPFPNQFYEDAGGALDIVPASGFFLNAIVGVSAPPDGEEVIARNGGVAAEGWELVMFDPGLAFPAVNFRFRVFDGVGPVEVTVFGTPGFSLDPSFVNPSGFFNFPDRVFFRISCAFFVPGSPVGGAFGAIAISVEGRDSTAPTLAAAYVNTTPLLLVGSDTLRAFEDPNCIHGVAGGTAPWSSGAVFPVTAHQWAGSVAPLSNSLIGTISDGGSYQLEPMPDPSSLGVVNTNGWRANYPELPTGDAPSPFLPFIGATPLLYANGPPSGALTVSCEQPSVFWSELGIA